MIETVKKKIENEMHKSAKYLFSQKLFSRHNLNFWKSNECKITVLIYVQCILHLFCQRNVETLANNFKCEIVTNHS